MAEPNEPPEDDPMRLIELEELYAGLVLMKCMEGAAPFRYKESHIAEYCFEVAEEMMKARAKHFANRKRRAKL